MNKHCELLYAAHRYDPQGPSGQRASIQLVAGTHWPCTCPGCSSSRPCMTSARHQSLQSHPRTCQASTSCTPPGCMGRIPAQSNMQGCQMPGQLAGVGSVCTCCRAAPAPRHNHHPNPCPAPPAPYDFFLLPPG
jgi:hypothetical protein